MMKMIGILMIAFSVVAYGLTKYKEMQKSLIEINKVISVFERYRSSLTFSHASFSEIADKYGYAPCYNAEPALDEFFSLTGKGSLENEIALCDETLSKLYEIRNTVIEKNKKTGTLNIKLSLAAALALIIILI